MIRHAIAAALVVLVPATAVGQISPGELAAPHESLEGMKNCLKCHKLGSGPSVERCLECHQEIMVRMNAKKGYHHNVVKAESKTCFACHSDHAGRSFQLVNWPGGRDRFDHSTTGWSLEGLHAKAQCRDCHAPDLIKEDFSAYAANVNVKTTFLGLHNGCSDCHMDEHRGQLLADCSACHTPSGFSPVTIDHDKTAFPLSGRHVEVACTRCHAVEPDSKPWDHDNGFARYKPVAHNACALCHTDVHKGSLGAACASCHQTSGWHDVAMNDFDHAATDFPLRGLHTQVTCNGCHTSGSYTAPLAFATCDVCHGDPHRGQFAHRADGGACESCHADTGFTPPRFTLADHSNTGFPLEGAHLAQPCDACHLTVKTQTGEEFLRFKFGSKSCVDCHVDVHQGQLEPKSCDDCHGVNSWPDIVFDHNRDTSYPLEGEHKSVLCGACHPTSSRGSITLVQYKPIDPSCKNCHTVDGIKLRSGEI